MQENHEPSARSVAIEILEWLNFDTSLEAVAPDIYGVQAIITEHYQERLTLLVEALQALKDSGMLKHSCKFHSNAQGHNRAGRDVPCAKYDAVKLAFTALSPTTNLLKSAEDSER